MTFLNWSNLAICIAVLFSISGSFAQAMSTSRTPSQEGFEAGLPHTMPATQTPYQEALSVGLSQPKSIPETPSQARFETGNGRQVPHGSSTAGFNLTISKVIKEGDALHVLVANNGPFHQTSLDGC